MAREQDREASVIVTLKGGGELTAGKLDFLRYDTEYCVLVVGTGRDQVVFRTDEISGWRYSTRRITTGAEEAETYGAPTARLLGGRIVLSGLRAGSECRLLTSAGALVAGIKADGDGRAEMATQSLPSGVYLLSADGITFKFMVK